MHVDHAAFDSPFIEHQKSEVTVLSEEFEVDGVIITLGIGENAHYSYHVSAIPQLTSVTSIGSARFQFEIPYNTLYNVSVVAAHLCGQNNVTTFIDLYYSKCDIRYQ